MENKFIHVATVRVDYFVSLTTNNVNIFIMDLYKVIDEPNVWDAKNVKPKQ